MRNKSDFELFEFSNGFRLAWEKTDSETILANLRVNHGALNEVSGEEGTAHFLEHMLINGGTDKYSPEQQARINEAFGYANAFTSRERTFFPYGMVQSDLESYLDMASQMVFYPRLDEKIIEQQKNIVLREIARSKGAPDFEDIVRFFWPSVSRTREHSYFVLGDEEIVKNLSKVKLRNFHEKGYSPNNMILMLSGNLPDDFLKNVEKYFSHRPRGPGSPVDFPIVSPLEDKVVIYSSAKDLMNKDNPEESNSRLVLGFSVPDEFHGESESLRVTAEVLGRSRTTGIRKRIREDEGMSYDIGSGYSGDRKFGFFSIGGKIYAKRIEEAVDIIFEEINKLKDSKPDEDEVLRAKKRIAYRTSNSVGGLFDRIDADLVNIKSVSRMDYFFNERVPIEERQSKLENVSPESVQKVSQEYLPAGRESGKYVMLVRDPFR